MKTFEKLNDNTLKIVETKTVEVVSDYTYSDLVSMRDNLVQKKADFNAKIDLEIADLNTTISEADRLGVSEEVAEE